MRAIWIVAVAVFALAGSSERAAMQSEAWPPVLEAPAAGEVAVVPVQGDVHMIVGAGANITVQAGADGVLRVDTGTAAMSEPVWAAVRSIADGPLRYVINTVPHVDHWTGNAFFDAPEAPDYRFEAAPLWRQRAAEAGRSDLTTNSSR